MKQVARLTSTMVEGKATEGQISDYFGHSEPWSRVPSHRALAMFRGGNEGFLTLDLAVDPDAPRGDTGRSACGSGNGHGRRGVGAGCGRPLAARGSAAGRGG